MACPVTAALWISILQLQEQYRYRGNFRKLKIHINMKYTFLMMSYTYGCKKCSNSQARRTDTARSGRPLCGRQMLWGWLNAFALAPLRRARPPPMRPKFAMSSLPRQSFPAATLLLVLRSWLCIVLFRYLKCFDIVRRAMEAKGAALLSPATVSNEVITAWRDRKSVV